MAGTGLLLALAVLAANGCGPLGAYNLAHSFFDHHHVFRPVMPEEMSSGDDIDQPLAGSNSPAREKCSSSSTAMPMENIRLPIDTAAEADAGRAIAGDRPCGD